MGAGDQERRFRNHTKGVAQEGMGKDCDKKKKSWIQKGQPSHASTKKVRNKLAHQ